MGSQVQEPRVVTDADGRKPIFLKEKCHPHLCIFKTIRASWVSFCGMYVEVPPPSLGPSQTPPTHRKKGDSGAHGGGGGGGYGKWALSPPPPPALQPDFLPRLRYHLQSNATARSQEQATKSVWATTWWGKGGGGGWCVGTPARSMTGWGRACVCPCPGRGGGAQRGDRRGAVGAGVLRASAAERLSCCHRMRVRMRASARAGTRARARRLTPGAPFILGCIAHANKRVQPLRRCPQCKGFGP